MMHKKHTCHEPVCPLLCALPRLASGVANLANTPLFLEFRALLAIPCNAHKNVRISPRCVYLKPAGVWGLLLSGLLLSSVANSQTPQDVAGRPLAKNVASEPRTASNAVTTEEVADNDFNTAKKLYEQRQYQQALALFKQALSVDSKHRPKKAIEELLFMAACHKQLQQFQATIQLTQQALQLAEQTLGKMSLYVALSLNNLAALYHDLGKYAQAKPLYLRTLTIHEKVYGPVHATVAASLYNLAAVYHSYIAKIFKIIEK